MEEETPCTTFTLFLIIWYQGPVYWDRMDTLTSYTYMRTRLRVQLGQLKTQIHKFPYMLMAYSKGASILTKAIAKFIQIHNLDFEVVREQTPSRKYPSLRSWYILQR